ncbi:MAG TPA: glycosyltransferase family 2 protein [Baekduia sp.]|nr:glycosyltransferase family 2 protein [Baekduia sp.]
MSDATTADVDVVVVAYNSAASLEPCLRDLRTAPGVRLIVVDNHSPDASAEVARRLGADVLALGVNGGFAHGCNAGWRHGDAQYVLFLNPDAEISAAALGRLVAELERDPRVGIAAPKILEQDGTLAFSQRHFPRRRSIFAQALFLHRVLGDASWTDELVRAPEAYERRNEPDWVSGACMLVRRTLLEELGGWDDGFFMYREDIDLCKRARAAGAGVRFVPDAVIGHEGGASAPRAAMIPVLAESRVRYARKHGGPGAALVERLGVALHALSHMVAARGGRSVRAGHVQALRRAVSR